VDADLADYFGSIPHSDLLKVSPRRRPPCSEAEPPRRV
jgi:hypothetical protein